MKRPAKSVITGAVALLLLLTGFQLAMLVSAAARKPETEVSPVTSDTLKTYDPSHFAPIPVNLNRADSVALLDLPGIGPYYASRILRYRERLGSYAVKEQLLEIRGIDMEKFRRMESEIEILPQDVRMVDIWSVPADSMSSHPYLDMHSARAIVIFRENRPRIAWKIDSLLEAGAISERSARGLRLYFD